MAKKRKRKGEISGNNNGNEKNDGDDTNKCVNELCGVRKIEEQLRAYVLGGSAKVSKTACEFIMNRIGEYENIMSRLLCKNERLKGSLAVYKKMGECGTGGSVVSPISANVDVLPKVNVSEKKNYAVIVKSVDEKMTGERMKDNVFKYVKPDVKVRVRAVCKTKNGVVIEPASERERQFLCDCKKYENVGLKV